MINERIIEQLAFCDMGDRNTKVVYRAHKRMKLSQDVLSRSLNFFPYVFTVVELKLPSLSVTWVQLFIRLHIPKKRQKKAISQVNSEAIVLNFRFPAKQLKTERYSS